MESEITKVTEVTVQHEDFELVTDTTGWKPTALMRINPVKKKGLCTILLVVNFENKTTEIQTRADTDSVDVMECLLKTNMFPANWEQHGLVRTYELPANVDASRLAEYYNSTVKPLLQEFGQNFKSVWTGHNFDGAFSFPEAEDMFERDSQIRRILLSVPIHYAIAYFDIVDALTYMSEISGIITCGDLVNIIGYTVEEFVNLNLDDRRVFDEIEDALYDNYIYLTDITKELKRVQEVLRDSDATDI